MTRFRLAVMVPLFVGVACVPSPSAFAGGFGCCALLTGGAKNVASSGECEGSWFPLCASASGKECVQCRCGWQGTDYDPTEFGCCSRNNLFKVDGSESCCDGKKYVLNTEGCCGKTIYHTATQGCCDGVVYNSLTRKCVNGVVQKDPPAKRSHAPHPIGASRCKSKHPAVEGCCDGNTYKLATQGCCDGVVYNSLTRKCVNGVVVVAGCCDIAPGTCDEISRGDCGRLGGQFHARRPCNFATGNCVPAAHKRD